MCPLCFFVLLFSAQAFGELSAVRCITCSVLLGYGLHWLECSCPLAMWRTKGWGSYLGTLGCLLNMSVETISYLYDDPHFPLILHCFLSKCRVSKKKKTLVPDRQTFESWCARGQLYLPYSLLYHRGRARNLRFSSSSISFLHAWLVFSVFQTLESCSSPSDNMLTPAPATMSTCCCGRAASA